MVFLLIIYGYSGGDRLPPIRLVELEVTDYLPLGWWSWTNKPLWLAI